MFMIKKTLRNAEKQKEESNNPTHEREAHTVMEYI